MIKMLGRGFSNAIARSKLVFTAQHYQEWASVMKDYNPIHDCTKIDLKKPPIPKVVVPGKLSFFPFTQLIAENYPSSIYQSATMSFKAPIYFYDDVEVIINETERTDKTAKIEGRILKLPMNQLCTLFQATITL
eukprot:TRINITY_DN17080_c0_g2_i2.p1 TRINITY_DN17080_c0_g2~~TRINITY_DN17080_c0_g2_i2.p1  ORF type:complete len:134 (+),score=7.74 TRINITY_DN17080_c0_g2_i2:124-525(+)